MDVVRQRIVKVSERLAATKLSLQAVESLLASALEGEASRQLIQEWRVVEKTEQLATSLEQADNLLEVSELFFGLGSDLSSMLTTASATDARKLFENLLEDISHLRAQCADASKTVARIRDVVAAAGEDITLTERIKQALPFAAQAAATLGSLDSRLDKLAARLSEAQSRLEQARTQARRWVFASASVVTLLVCWMAAGQIALFRMCWAGWRSAASGLTRSIGDHQSA